MFELHARYQWRGTPPNTHRSLLPLSHFCVKIYKLKTSGHIWKFSTFNDCYIIGDINCVVCSCTRDPTGEQRSETSIRLSLTRHTCMVCVYMHRHGEERSQRKTKSQIKQTLNFCSCDADRSAATTS